MFNSRSAPFLSALLVSFSVFAATPVFAQANNAVAAIAALAESEQPKLLDTLKALVNIETGSTHRDGLDTAAEFIGARLKALGGEVEIVEAPAADIYQLEGLPDRIGRAVRATFRGTGSKRILLIAHMDTVYPVGMLSKQPFRIDGDRAFGLGISDDKQGVATIIHVVSMLQALNVRDYGVLTVLINGDEEISSPASRKLLAKLGSEHDADALVRSITPQQRQNLPRDQRHRDGDDDGQRSFVTRRRRTGAWRQRALRNGASVAATA